MRFNISGFKNSAYRLGFKVLGLENSGLRILGPAIYHQLFKPFKNNISGRNKCPNDFPYSYDYGQKCCSSPFKYDPTATLTSTQQTTILKPTDTTDCYGATEDCKYMKASNNIKNPCRTNLDVLSNFKGSQSKDVSYPAIKVRY